MPRILYICSSWPRGRSFGGQIRALHLGLALQEVGDVHVLVVSSEANDHDAQIKTASDFFVLPPIQPTVQSNQNVRQKLRLAFDSGYMNLHGVACSPADRARLDGLLPQYDLTWVLNSRTPNTLQRWFWPRAHLDLDDVPSVYLRSVARNSSHLKDRLKARVLWQLQLRRERRFVERFSTLSVCSEDDKCYLSGDDRMHIIPNGFVRPTAPPVRLLDHSRPRIGFIGLYSYAPNLEGMRWFLTECWPNILRSVPGVRLRLIGKDTDGPLKPSEANVDALGWLADPSSEIATWSAMIVPVRFGGGTRIKLAEAFGRKCPAVSTSMGAYGYEIVHGKQLLLADDASHFAASCINLIRHPELGSQIATSAWEDFLHKWTWEAITKRIIVAANHSLQISSKDSQSAA